MPFPAPLRRLAALLAAVVVLAGAGEVRATAPNFLVIVADDMRADAIGAAGHPTARTPVLDRLWREGHVFHAAYCFGSNSGAVCVPSRAMLMAGRSYLALPPNLDGVRTLPERLEERGYDTFLAGKWHNGEAACARSFARGEAVFLGGMTDQFHPRLATLADHRLGPAVRSEAFSTDAIAGAATRFLTARDRGRPFFAWVSFTVPHDPRTPRDTPDPALAGAAGPASPWRPKYDTAFSQIHRPADQRLPADFLPQHPFDNGWLTVRDEELLGWPRDPDAVRRELAAYHGLITHLDARVGDLMAALEQTGDAAHTYVVFLADHGLALGSHGLLGKQSLYEHSMRAPLLIRGPGVPPGSSSRDPVYLHDLHATVLELAGLPPEPVVHETDSRSLVSHWQAPAAAPSAARPGRRTRLLLAFTDTMRALRAGDWKLIRYPQVDVTQLFDLRADPHEVVNLAAREPARVAALRRDLEAAQQAAGDSLPWTATRLRATSVDLTARPRDPYAGRPWDRPARRPNPQ